MSQTSQKQPSQPTKQESSEVSAPAKKPLFDVKIQALRTRKVLEQGCVQ